MTAYFLGKVCLAKHLEPAIPEECLVNKLSYHYDEDIIRARRGSQIKTVQGMTELLESYENEEYYRQSGRRKDQPEIRINQMCIRDSCNTPISSGGKFTEFVGPASRTF